MCVKKNLRSGALGRTEVVNLAQQAGSKAGNAEECPVGSFRRSSLCFVMFLSGTNEVFQLFLAKHPTKNIYEVKSKLVRVYNACYQYIW